MGEGIASLRQIVNCVSFLIDKDMFRESISKMKDEKTAGTSDLVLKKVKSAREAEAGVIKDLVNQIIVKGVTTPGWALL